MQTMGLSPFGTFCLLGMVFLLLVVLAGAIMENPPENATGFRYQSRIAGVLKDRAFVLLYLAMFAGLAAGFAINANMKE